MRNDTYSSIIEKLIDCSIFSVKVTRFLSFYFIQMLATLNFIFAFIADLIVSLCDISLEDILVHYLGRNLNAPSSKGPHCLFGIVSTLLRTMRWDNTTNNCTCVRALCTPGPNLNRLALHSVNPIISLRRCIEFTHNARIHALQSVRQRSAIDGRKQWA